MFFMGLFLKDYNNLLIKQEVNMQQQVTDNSLIFGIN